MSVNELPAIYLRAAWLLALSAAVPSVASSQSNARDLRRATAISADPNTPTFGLGWRNAVRGQLGATLPLWASPESEGLVFALSPLIELHEPARSPQALPSQYWRARVTLSGAVVIVTDSAAYRIGLALEHESDHETAHAYSSPGFLALNAATLGALASFQAGDFALSVAPSARMYVASCTRERSACRNFQGAASAGGQLDLTLSAPGLDLWELVPFASASGFGVLPHAAIGGETHVEVHLGLAYEARFLLIQLFALGYFGNDVGITRMQRVTQFGGGLRLSL